ncbi:TPA: hypothetical protein ACIZMA_000477 [Streptococcus agalactiae]
MSKKTDSNHLQLIDQSISWCISKLAVEHEKQSVGTWYHAYR